MRNPNSLTITGFMDGVRRRNRGQTEFHQAGHEWARDVIRERGLAERLEEGTLRAILISPVWGDIDLRELAAWILEDGLPVRFQLQLHKQIWGAEATGV